jgi:hypothetical protein
MLVDAMPSKHDESAEKQAPTMHRWTTKHYVFSIIVILLAVGMFAYSWS